MNRQVFFARLARQFRKGVFAMLGAGLVTTSMLAADDATDSKATESPKPETPKAEKFFCPVELPEGELPITGTEVPQLRAFDEMMTSYMKKHGVPGGSLAIMRNGKLVYARGFGYANVEQREPLSPQSILRIASISKPITAVAILQLVEQGKLKLDDKVFDLLGIEPHVSRRRKPDPRLKDITVLHCLQHTAGWDREKSFDPMFEPRRIARALGVESPPGPREAIRYIQSRPLDFSPGERFAYANIDYCILGRIIEKISGKPYQEYVQDHIFQPMAIHSMRLGRTLPEDRAEGEVCYYNGDKTEPSVFAKLAGKEVPLQYGAFCIEWMDSHGGWLSTAADVARFASAFDDPKNSPLLKPETIATMWQRPEGAAGHDRNGNPSEKFYGCGWAVRPEGNGQGNAVHSGALEGTSTLLVHRNDGVNMAVLFNARYTRDERELINDLMPLMHEAADGISQWPDAEVSTYVTGATKITQITGQEIPELKGVDDLTRSFMAEHDIPGGSVAISRHGKVIYARGFGFADIEANQAVEPQSLFRIASISKPITAVAIMRLVEQGKLKLDDKVFDLLGIEPFKYRKYPVDPRVREISVLQCLQHTAGWDRGKSYDAMFIPMRIAEAMQVQLPVGTHEILSFMQGQPLDFDPGTQYAYSNLGYCALGRVIEKLTGESYHDYVVQEVLKPLGIDDMKLGRSLEDERQPGEVKYYEPGRTGLAVVGDAIGKKVPSTYGSFYLESMDSHGGWIASAPDLVRFASAVLDDPSKSLILKPATIATMLERPQGKPGLDKDGKPAKHFYACGWLVENIDGQGQSVQHAGSLPGTSTILHHRPDGINIAILFNTRRMRGKGISGVPVKVLLPEVEKVLNQVKKWPEQSVALESQN